MLYIVRGLPGSGKSTFAHSKRFAGALVLENDMYHVKDGKYKFDRENMPDAIYWCQEACRNALEHGMDVVVANTFTKPEYIKIFEEMAKHYGHEFKVLKCTGNWQNVHNVPEDVLNAMRSGWQDWPGEEVVDFNQAM